MFNRNHVCAIAAVAAFSMLSLIACSDENSDITGVSGESALSSSSTPLIEQPSSSSEQELSSSSAPSVETESSSDGFVNLCEPLIEGAITRFWVKDEGDRLKDACSEPLTVIGDDIYAEDCNAKNDGRVLSLWSGNPKYGYMTYYKCQKDSWVKGDISLTCDTAGVAVGDTCVKQYSINIFQAGMNPTGTVVSFVYKGDGVWERDNQAQIDSLARIDSLIIERRNRRDAAMKEYCGVPESGKVSECCYPVPDEFAADYANNTASILYTSEPDSDDWDLQGFFENKNCVMDAEEAIIEE